MPHLTAMDEQFVHQIPEPLPNVVTYHPFWRESLFFVVHPRAGLGDVVILTLAHFPARGEMDSLQLGRVGGVSTVARHARPYDGDPHTMAADPSRLTSSSRSEPCTSASPRMPLRRSRSTSHSPRARASTRSAEAR